MPRLPGIEALYTAANAFKQAALVSDDSLFTPGRPIWSEPVLSDLYERFVNNPIETSDAFEVKFQRQLAGAPPDTIQLAGEVLFVYFLAARSIYADTKKALVNQVLSWSSEPVEIPRSLEEPLSVGIAQVGTAFNTRRPNQLAFLLEFGLAWKRLTAANRARLLEQPWEFREMVFALPVRAAHTQREALLHLVFPETFEPIVSHDVKERIADHFAPNVDGSEQDVDARLAQVRLQLTPEFGENFRFYAPEVAKLWQPDITPWGQFIAWGRRFFEWNEFDSIERSYKRGIRQRLRDARDAVRANDPTWLEKLKVPFGGDNNLTPWRENAAFLQWCAQRPDYVRDALASLWDEEQEVNSRIRSFDASLDPHVLQMRLPIISFLLMAESEQFPVFRREPFELSMKLTASTSLPKTDDRAELYSSALAFLDRVIEEADKRGLTLQTRFDAQSLVWSVARWPSDQPPVMDWSDADRQAFKSFRRERRILKVAPGERARFWPDCQDGNFICIGWDEVGDLTQYPTKAAFAQAFREKYLAEYNGNASQTSRKANELWAVHRLKPGDIVVANRGVAEVLAVGEVQSDGYRYRPDRAEYKHTVAVAWDTSYARPIPEQRNWATVTVAEIPPALFDIITGQQDGEIRESTQPDRVAPTVLRSATSSTGFQQIMDRLAAKGFDFSEETVSCYLLGLQTKRFVILSGISGTGKTRLAMSVADSLGGSPRSAGSRATYVPRGGVEVQVQPYMLDHHQIVVPAALADTLEAASDLANGTGGTTPLPVRYPGGLENLSLRRNVSKGVLVLSFAKGGFRTWFDEHLSIGDRFVLAQDHGSEGDAFALNIPGPGEVAEADENVERSVVVAVRPDWTDNRGLLGYFNPITNRYSATPFLRLMLHAKAEVDRAGREHRRARPFFAILDEMNLARVEHYFSDFLSALESGEPIELHSSSELEAGQSPDELVVPRRLSIPTNLYFTGTVNVDETTYMFSPKVLDRAFTMELNRVDLALYGGENQAAVSERQFALGRFAGTLSGERPPDASDWKAFTTLLDGELCRVVVDVHGLLSRDNRHFGYRVANEIARFVVLASEQTGGTAAELWTALDLAILQKVLPKFNGTRQELQESLATLFSYTCTTRLPEGTGAPVPHTAYELRGDELLASIIDDADQAVPQPRLPRSAAKVWRMLRRLELQGFTSFIE